MRLDGALTEAASGLAAINRELATVAQNVANASTPGYVRETLPLQSVVAGGEPMGVRSGIASRSVDGALQQDVFAAGGAVADSDVRRSVLASIDQASGAPGAGQDVASLVGALRDGFSTLQGDPSNQTQQRAVVDRAGALARGVNALGHAVSDARQSAQDNLVQDVQTANAALGTIGRLSDQIMVARGRGESTADLEDQRDTAMASVSALTGARFFAQANGDVLAASGGTVLPIRAGSGPLSLAAATLAPGTAAGAVPALQVSGVAAPIAGGRIGAELDLRDHVLPGLQAGVDGFAQALATGFAGAGLTLFTDASGAVPPVGTAGFAQEMQVAPAVSAAPSMVRDGAAAATTAGNTALIDTLLGGVLATGSGTVAGQASDLVARQASLSASAAGRSAREQAVQAGLASKLQAGTGVSVDTELSHMVQLQNSYAANAKVVAAVQTMFTQLMASVQ